MTELTNRRVAAPEWLAVAACCAAASLAALAWSWQNGALLNYGDAVAHLHIARRVFDSRLPRLTELGSVWLPLPHMLMLPFVQVYSWWANGIAGAIPSALAYLAACAGVYRLARRWLAPAPSALALAFFALNPNLLYLQTTAMTEPLFVCEMIWIAVALVEWRAALKTTRRKRSRLQGLIAGVGGRHLYALRRLDHGACGVGLHGPGAAAARPFAVAGFWLASVCFCRADCVVCL